MRRKIDNAIGPYLEGAANRPTRTRRSRAVIEEVLIEVGNPQKPTATSPVSRTSSTNGTCPTGCPI